MTDLRSYLRERAPLAGLAAGCGVALALLGAPAESDDVVGLQGALSDQDKLLVGSVAWEPSRGAFSDLILGRPILFEASSTDDALEQRDIYRAFVRLSPEGRVLDVLSARNLTGTRRADEYGLGARGSLAWFGAQGEEARGSITFLHLNGEQHHGAATSFTQRIQLGLSRLVETGTWSGLGRSDLFWDGHDLSVEIGDQVSIRAGAQSKTFSSTQLFSPHQAPDDAPYQFVYRQREPSAWLHWAANTGRHIVGSGAIAWAEGRAFSLWDNLNQVGYSVTGGGKSRAPIALPAPPEAGQSTSAWPPPNIIVPGRESTSEGKWIAVKSRFLPSSPEPHFYRTVIHPDPDRPYAELHLVAMDMRRLELGIGAGYEDPHPDTGPPGSGQLPTRGNLPERVVATFNGAFKAIHGQYGMKAEGRLLVEPVDGAATVVVDESGSAGFGTWSAEDDPETVIALRQNLDPLVAAGEVNPAGRKIWGDQLYGSGVAVERSALCVHASGHLLYGWATEATGQSLAQGMAAAGCAYAIHLDMNPGHCAFLFNRVRSVNPLEADGEALDPRMKVNPTRFIRWSPKDFFYIATRSGLPDDGSIRWQVAPGKGLSPETIPGIFLGKKMVGSLEIEFDRIERGRLNYSLTPGQAEPQAGWEAPPEGSAAALIAWGLGHRTHGFRTGLTMGKSVLVPLHRNYASLILRNGELSLLPPAEPQAEEETIQIAQLPALARDGELTEAARELGGKRKRSALCIDDNGTVLIARMTHDTPAPLAQALLDLGCSLVVAMDRGSHPPPLVERAGTESPPHEGYEQTMLYGISRKMRPRTHLF